MEKYFSKMEKYFFGWGTNLLSELLTIFLNTFLSIMRYKLGKTKASVHGLLGFRVYKIFVSKITGSVYIALKLIFGFVWGVIASQSNYIVQDCIEIYVTQFTNDFSKHKSCDPHGIRTRSLLLTGEPLYHLSETGLVVVEKFSSI
jgi:hypothetical protein